MAPDVKTLVRPTLEQADHYSTHVTPAACNQPLQCLAKGQVFLLKAQVSLPGKSVAQSLVRFDLTGYSGIKYKNILEHSLQLMDFHQVNLLQQTATFIQENLNDPVQNMMCVSKS